MNITSPAVREIVKRIAGRKRMIAEIQRADTSTTGHAAISWSMASITGAVMASALADPESGPFAPVIITLCGFAVVGVFADIGAAVGQSHRVRALQELNNDNLLDVGVLVYDGLAPKEDYDAVKSWMNSI